MRRQVWLEAPFQLLYDAPAPPSHTYTIFPRPIVDYTLASAYSSASISFPPVPNRSATRSKRFFVVTDRHTAGPLPLKARFLVLPASGEAKQFAVTDLERSENCYSAPSTLLLPITVQDTLPLSHPTNRHTTPPPIPWDSSCAQHPSFSFRDSRKLFQDVPIVCSHAPFLSKRVIGKDL